MSILFLMRVFLWRIEQLVIETDKEILEHDGFGKGIDQICWPQATDRKQPELQHLLGDQQGTDAGDSLVGHQLLRGRTSL